MRNTRSKSQALEQKWQISFRGYFRAEKNPKNPKKIREMCLVIRYHHEKKEFVRVNISWLFGLFIENGGGPYSSIPITNFFPTHMIVYDDVYE